MRRRSAGQRPGGHTPAPGDRPTHLIVGRVLAPWGCCGEVRVEILTDFPDRFSGLQEIVVGPDMTPRRLQSARPYRKQLLLKMEGIETPEQAAAVLQGQYLYVPLAQAMPLGKDQYYHYQILGLEVVTGEGVRLGPIVEILETGANDVYVVDADTQEILIPALAHVVQEVDLEHRRMVVTLPPGLLGEEES